jgi:hypothetical protein
MKKLAIIATAILCISGCTNMKNIFGASRTLGEIESGYTYVPVDPISVQATPGRGCCGDGYTDISQGQTLLEALPDNAVRMLVESFDLSGSVSYGVSKTGTKDNVYRVTIDYINADTINIPFKIAKYMKPKKKQEGELKMVYLFSPPPSDVEPGSETYTVYRIPEGEKINMVGETIYIPVYLGIGLRITANIYVIGASANISGIGIIGAEAEAQRVKGSLVLQTLGVNGKSITAALPIQSELNRTTAQNAIVAVGSIKALLYADESIKSPRVVGLYLPSPGGKLLVNKIISELQKAPIKWEYSCRKRSQQVPH